MGTVEAQMAASELQLHTLTSSATDDDIQRVLSLFSAVFLPFNNAAGALDDHSSLTVWRERLSNPRSRIMFVTRTDGDSTSHDVGQPLGFFFNLPRTQPELDFETLHIWLAGISEEARGLRIFPMLMERTISYAKDCGYEYITVATVPAVFGRMWSILRGSGWTVVAEKDSDLGRKVVLKLKL